MKYLLKIFVLLLTLNTYAQVDYSSSWTDFYSYNNIVDFTKVSDVIYAVTENAVFTYDIKTQQIEKFSSINGLSGQETSSIYFDENLKLLVIGYNNGLLEIIDQQGNITKVVDISLSNISTEKQINSIYGFEDQIYLSLGFGVVVYDLINFEFGDTYFIGQNSTEAFVNELVIYENEIFAATEDGVYVALLDNNLSDSNNWLRFSSGQYSVMEVFKNQVLTSKGNKVYQIVDSTVLEFKVALPNTIVDMSSNSEDFAAVTSKQAFLYDSNFELLLNTNSSSNTLTAIEVSEDCFYLGSMQVGVLKSFFSSVNDFEEIHPEGPSSNKLFSITVHNSDLWCVYGGIAPWYAPLGNKKGVSHFNGKQWTEVLYGDANGVDLAKDLLHVTVDPLSPQTVYISSWAQKNGPVDSTDGGGVLVLKNDQFLDFWNAANSGLSNFLLPSSPTYTTTRIYGSSFDSSGDFWLINSLTSDGTGALKKKSKEGIWTDHSLAKSNIEFNVLKIDLLDNIWIGSRGEGLFVYNKSIDKSANLKGTTNGIPNNNVRAIGIGRDGNIWIGTADGVVLFSDVDNLFGDFRPPEAVIIETNDGVSELLDGLEINDIQVDGAGNVWFATTSGGVLQTNSTGRIVLNGFNTDNSPLASNNILSIGIDESTGAVYFGTEGGVVSFQGGVISYGEELSEVYAYPNPSLKNNEEIKIVGKDTPLPEGTNIKILDVAGNLVFESNASQNQSPYGGRFIWDKRNLAGRKVASGVYIVLLFNTEGQQTASTKIAIIN